jgi:hypothetical protein
MFSFSLDYIFHKKIVQQGGKMKKCMFHQNVGFKKKYKIYVLKIKPNNDNHL